MANLSFHKLSAFPFDESAGFCATIGFFDGVHRGHHFLIEELLRTASERRLNPLVISFEEHPKLALSPAGYWPELLTTNDEKLKLLAQEGIPAVALLHFDVAMSRLTSAEFMQQILRDHLNVRCLLTGYDHHFGSDRASGFRDYVLQGKDLGIEVVKAQPFECDGIRISSSATRRFLHAGNVEMARMCLGRPYRLSGIVVEGHKAGSAMGWPTANLQPRCAEQVVPGKGVYVAKAVIHDGDSFASAGFSYMAMVNIGCRPTLDNGNDCTIEAHLLDWTGDALYGAHMTLSFYRRIRDEKRFASIEELQARIALDADFVKEFFASNALED